MSVASTEGAGLKLNPQWWYLRGRAYDLSDFVAAHPGGEQAINLGRGRDCTALFESYHVRLPSQSMLDRYQVISHSQGDKKYPLRINHEPYTFDESGFFRTVKRRARDHFRFVLCAPVLCEFPRFFSFFY